MSNTLPPLTDNPVEHLESDAFGFRPHIERLDAVVAAAHPLPLTVGIFGPWGSGKSSFLRMWQDLMVSNDDRSHAIWFNPWKYDQKVDVWAALIQSLLAELKKNRRIADTVTSLARQVTWLMLRGGLGKAGELATAGILDKATFEQALDAIASRDSEYCQFINEFEHSFAQAVAQYVGEHGRLVVFVDDLDRCTPEAALTVLEALKLFIGDARCVFVLAMDFDVVAAAAEAKFGESSSMARSGYLEKIIQIPFFLPEVRFTTLVNSVTAQVGPLAESNEFWELVEIGFGANPRRVKRYINVFNLATAILNLTGSSRDAIIGRLQLAELLIIRSEHREFFRHLTRSPGAWRRLEEAVAAPKEPGGEATVDSARVDADLRKFAEDSALVRLLGTKPGGYLDHPAALSGKEIVTVLSTVQLTTGPLEAS